MHKKCINFTANKTSKQFTTSATIMGHTHKPQDTFDITSWRIFAGSYRICFDGKMRHWGHPKTFAGTNGIESRIMSHHPDTIANTNEECTHTKGLLEGPTEHLLGTQKVPGSSTSSRCR